MNDLACLDAPSFHSRLGDLLRTEFAALGAFLVALAEFDRRKLFRQLGHASLFDYLHKGLRLSRGAAHHRRAGASLVQRFPEVLEPIEDGRLCFSTVAVVPERTVVTTLEKPELPVTMTAPEGRHEIAGESGQIVHLGEPGTVRATLEVEASKTVAPATATVVPMTATVSRLHITVSREFLALLKKARAGGSHRNPGATDEHIVKLALEALVEKQSKRTGSVPAKGKREVVKRDDGKRQWKLPDGSIRGATARL